MAGTRRAGRGRARAGLAVAGGAPNPPTFPFTVMKLRPVLPALVLLLFGAGVGARADPPAALGAVRPGPALANSQLYADLAAATRQNEQLKAALAELELRFSLREGDLADASRQLKQLLAQAGSPTNAETALKAELAQVHGELDQARAAAVAAQSAQAGLQNQQEQTMKQLAAAQAQLAALRSSNPASAGLGQPNAAELTQLRQDRDQARAATANAQLAQAGLQSQLEQASRQLADANDKLAQSLHAFTLQQAELDRAKATFADTDAARVAAAAELAAQRTTATRIAEELAGLREQLRLTQAAAGAATTENQALKSRLARADGQAAPTPLNPPAVVFPAPDPPPVLPASAPAAEPNPPAVSPSNPPSPTPEPAPASEPRVHVVVAGDTLSGLAKKYYGDRARWETILAANRALIKNPDVLALGARLQIP